MRSHHICKLKLVLELVLGSIRKEEEEVKILNHRMAEYRLVYSVLHAAKNVFILKSYFMLI